MQTFLPLPSFKESVISLDYRRLGKQRVEAKQILRALSNRKRGIKSGWQNHPAVLMWVGYEDALKQYYNCCINEWVFRGYKNSMRRAHCINTYTLPSWFGGRIHATHRSNLLRKDLKYYKRFNWPENADLAYYWPVTYNINKK